jgi:hypothetical protein
VIETAAGLIMLALGGAILGDLLVHVAGTNAVFSGVGNLLGSTYKAAAGGYSA